MKTNTTVATTSEIDNKYSGDEVIITAFKWMLILVFTSRLEIAELLA